MSARSETSRSTNKARNAHPRRRLPAAEIRPAHSTTTSAALSPATTIHSPPLNPVSTAGDRVLDTATTKPAAVLSAFNDNVHDPLSWASWLLESALSTPATSMAPPPTSAATVASVEVGSVDPAVPARADGARRSCRQQQPMDAVSASAAAVAAVVNGTSSTGSSGSVSNTLAMLLGGLV
ncbi:hypothetical protein HK405_010716 [Cladochytrium tenue]|nr:hypothetical protein HK405_010716 [Cladochytrium tenue]